jgi:hypothetical protein
MSDEPRRGRPPLRADDKSVNVTVKFPSRDVDDLYRRANAERTTVPDLIRRAVDREKPAK